MQWFSVTFLKLLLPLVLVAAAYFARDWVGTLGAEARAVVDNLPYVLCAISVLMSYQFNRLRLLLAAVGVAAYYWAVQTYLQVSLVDEVARQAYLGMSLCVPVMVLYLLLIPERGVWNLQGLAFTVGFAVLGLLCMQLGPWLPGVNETALKYYSLRPVDGYIYSIGATLLVALVAAASGAMMLLRYEETESALVGVLLALYLALAWLHLPNISVVMAAAASLIVLWGVLRSSHSMAYRDELTGLPSRRAMNERIKMLGNRFSIAMLDVDHFKQFNDTHGHDVGDEVLRLVASRLRNVGGGGVAYRYGGEEFCIIFPRRDLEDCVEPVGKVREAIADYRMSIRDKNLRPVRTREGSMRRGATRIKRDQVSVTVSAGLAARDSSHPDPESVIAAADRFLYKAKRAGRNRVAC